MSKPNNPHAFPVAYTDEHDFQAGMTLRDYFAAKALQALIIALPDAHKHKDGKTLRAELAIGAYMQADAMLKEREKQQ